MILVHLCISIEKLYMVTVVDDFLWVGSHVFIENVIKPLRKIFETGSVNEEVF